MSRMVGTVSRGVRAPIIREGDDIVKIVADSVVEAANSEGYEIRNRDIVAMTEAVVARAFTILPRTLRLNSARVLRLVLYSPFSAVTDLQYAFAVLRWAQRR